jgi:hypothetical protein
MLTGMIYCRKTRPMRMKRSLGNEGLTLIQFDLLRVPKGPNIIIRINNLMSLYHSVLHHLHSMKIHLNYLDLLSREKSTSTKKKKRRKRRPDVDSLRMMETQLLNLRNPNNLARRTMKMTIYCKSTYADRTKLYPSIIICLCLFNRYIIVNV